MCCGYSLEVPRWGTSNEYPQYLFYVEKNNIITFWVKKVFSCAGIHFHPNMDWKSVVSFYDSDMYFMILWLSLLIIYLGSSICLVP